MTPERYKKLTEIVEAVWNAVPQQRTAILQSMCGGDEELKCEAENLLKSDSQHEFLAEPAMGELLRGIEPREMPAQLGPYRIVRLIGEGGMGAVYEAEQDNPRRRVAVKTIRAGLRTPPLLRRFKQEASILGRLNHPLIARVYEAGIAQVKGESSPFIAMELVQGPALNEYVAKHNPDRVARLLLLAAIADAVQYAHQQGVVHRDLKPGNILIDLSTGTTSSDKPATGSMSGSTLSPCPKILDFGVALLTDEPEVSQTLRTEPGAIIGTLAYMSPEQVSGDSTQIDTRTDVYALGAILFELLTGHRPLKTEAMTLAQSIRTITEEDVSSASTYDRSLRGDLETICAKALEKDRTRRYQSASELAADIRRYLRDEPISARPATVTYQLRKFSRRHRGLVGGIAAAAVALIAGLAISTTMYFKAEADREKAEKAGQEEAKARKLADSETALSEAVRGYLLKDLLLSALPERRGYDVKMMDVLLHASEGMHERFKDRPDVEAQLHFDLGDVLSSLGKFKEGETEFRDALALWDVQKPQVEADFQRMTNCLALLAANLSAQQRFDEALVLDHKAVDFAEKHLPEDDRFRIQAQGGLGERLQILKRHDEARVVLERALAAGEKATGDVDQVVAAILSSLAASAKAQGHKEEALNFNLRSLERSKKSLGPDDPTVLGATNNLIGTLISLKHYEEAASLAVELAASVERVFPPGHPSRGFGKLSAGHALLRVHRNAEAEKCAVAAYEVFRKCFDETNNYVEQAAGLACTNYFDWHGHEAQALEWTLRCAHIRLMAETDPDGAGLFQSLQKAESRCIAANIEVGTNGLVEMLWKRRDEFVPPGENGKPGHQLRAVYLANLARLSASQHRLADQQSEMIAHAEAAVKDAANKEEAETLIRIGKSSIGK